MKTKTVHTSPILHWGLTFFFFFIMSLQVNIFSQANVTHGPDDCYENWKFKLYEDPYFQGELLCFRKGEYYLDRDCNNRHYQRFSFKIRQGYVVCFYDNRGRFIREMDRDERHAQFSFHKFVVKRREYGENPHTPGYVDCFPDWKFKLYERPNREGDFQCYRKGEYYTGDDCDDYRGRNISFELQPGYFVCFYDNHDRLLKKFTSSSNYYRGDFHKFVVKKMGQQGNHYDDDDDDVACFDDWRVKIYENPNYNGDFRCFRKGEYHSGQNCGDYNRRGISCRIKRGFQLWVYNNHGQCIRKFDRDVPFYNGDFYRFEVRRDESGGGYGH
ncbi:MAG: hypothetical protein R2828_27265 [Saprospiraceae bacterium]